MDPFLRGYIKDYTTFTETYRVLRVYMEKDTDIKNKLKAKTEKLIREHTELIYIGPLAETYEVNTETNLKET